MTRKNISEREVGVQSIMPQRDYVSVNILASKQLEKWEYNRFFYQTKTMTLLAIGYMAIIAYLIYTSQTVQSIESMHKNGMLAALVAFLMFSVVVLPDAAVSRPHPVFWRMIMGLGLLYAMFCFYLLFLPLDEARGIFSFFDKKLGKELPEKNYADDCRLLTPEKDSIFSNLYDTIWDVHFLAHFLGWWFKVLIIRDLKICWICSLLFEVCELTFRHWLPNFYECWWDHLLLDVFGCNLLGIMAGFLTLKLFSVPRMNWIYVKDKKVEDHLNNCSSVQRAAKKFKP